MNLIRFFQRLISPIIQPVYIIKGIRGYFWYISDLIKYKKLDKKFSLFNLEYYPLLHDKTSNTQVSEQYFHQQIWCFENILKNMPSMHIDVGSTYEMSGYISKIVPAKFVDIRPMNVIIPNLECVGGNICELPYDDDSVESISCLHVLEHIGLGRYGDPLDANGTQKGCLELKRVLAKNGKLYVSIPIGIERVCFNAHRVHSHKTILNYFSELNLIEFNIIDDNGNLVQNADINKDYNFDFGLGMFIFSK